MTAKQLIAAAAACTVCGKEHKQRKLSGKQVSWASPEDGHAYRTCLFEMTNVGSQGVIAALRQLAAGEGGD